MKSTQPDNLLQSAATSPQILNTSANLLGICFLVLTSLKLFNLSEKTVVDELTSASILFFMLSSFLSFLAMRNRGTYSERLEKIAEYVFLSGLLTLFATTMLITFNIMN